MATSTAPRNGGFDLRPRPPLAITIDPANGVSIVPVTTSEGSAPGTRQWIARLPGEPLYCVTHRPGLTLCTCPDFEERWECDHVNLLDFAGLLDFGDPDESDREGGE